MPVTKTASTFDLEFSNDAGDTLVNVDRVRVVSSAGPFTVYRGRHNGDVVWFVTATDDVSVVNPGFEIGGDLQEVRLATASLASVVNV